MGTVSLNPRDHQIYRISRGLVWFDKKTTDKDFDAETEVLEARHCDRTQPKSLQATIDEDGLWVIT